MLIRLLNKVREHLRLLQPSRSRNRKRTPSQSKSNSSQESLWKLQQWEVWLCPPLKRIKVCLDSPSTLGIVLDCQWTITWEYFHLFWFKMFYIELVQDMSQKELLELLMHSGFSLVLVQPERASLVLQGTFSLEEETYFVLLGENILATSWNARAICCEDLE